MSGHSKWHNIKDRKEKADQKKGQMFTKISKAITLAVRQGGGDPNMNFALRLAVDEARGLNMPKDNIDRAIKRGTGELNDGAVVDEVLYEGFGPGGVAILVEAATDNKNRTAPEIKHIFSRFGGNLGAPGSVKWQFEKKAVARISAETQKNISDWDSVQLKFMDVGAEDIKESENGVEIFSRPEKLKDIMNAISSLGIQTDDSGLEWVAKEVVNLSTDDSETLGKMIDTLEENDDVQEVYINEA